MRSSISQNAAKYISAAVTLTVVLTLSACHAIPRAPITPITPTPIKAVVNKIPAQTYSLAPSQTAESTAQVMIDDTLSRESFETLRKTAAETVPRGEGLGGALVNYLMDNSDESIMLALTVHLSEDELGTSEKRYHVAQIMVCEYSLLEGKLYESPCKSVPVLIKAKKGTDEIEHVSVPDLYDQEQYLKDIENIFGVETEQELGVWNVGDPVRSVYLRQYEEQLSSIKCDIALAGGFDGFANGVTQLLTDINQGGYNDAKTEEGALFAYYMHNAFSYSSLAVPFFHELGRTEKDSNTTLYGALYLGYIYAMDDGTMMTGAEIRPARIELMQSDGIFEAYDVLFGLTAEENYDAMLDSMENYRDDYLAFRKSADYEDYILHSDSVIDSLMEGTFDFDSDAFDFGK